MSSPKEKSELEVKRSSSISTDSGCYIEEDSKEEKERLYQDFKRLISELEKWDNDEDNKSRISSFVNHFVKRMKLTKSGWVLIDFEISKESKEKPFTEGSAILMVASTKGFLNRKNSDLILDSYKENSRKEINSISNFADENGSRILHILAEKIIEIKKTNPENFSREFIEIYEEMSDKFSETLEIKNSKGKMPVDIISELSTSFNQAKIEFYSITRDRKWLVDNEEKNKEIEEKLDIFFKQNPSFIEEWNSIDYQYPLTSNVLQSKNYKAFLAIIEELEKNEDQFRAEITAIDERDWNILNRFMSGLISASKASIDVKKEDSEILEKIISYIKKVSDKEDFLYNFLENEENKPLKMLGQIENFEDYESNKEMSESLEKIEQILADRKKF